MQPESSKTNRSKGNECRCKGAGWIVSPVNYDLIRCPQCTNLLAGSRLTEDEQHLCVDDIVTRNDDKTGEAIALRFLAKAMLQDPFGFLSVWGVPGNAKSLVLTTLVAEFCRRGTQAIYFNIDDVIAMLNPGDDTEVDGFRYVPGNPDANMNRLKQVPVLALDELDKAKWTSWQVQKIGALIEHRHRNASTLVTLFAMNKHPDQWSKGRGSDGKSIPVEIDHLIDRWLDGRFNRYWPADKTSSLPACLAEYKESIGGVTNYYAPGFFQTKLPSMRRTQRRYTQIAPNPRAQEIPEPIST